MWVALLKVLLFWYCSITASILTTSSRKGAEERPPCLPDTRENISPCCVVLLSLLPNCQRSTAVTSHLEKTGIVYFFIWNWHQVFLRKKLGDSYRNCHARVHASYVVSKLKCCTSKLLEFDFCFPLSGEHGVKHPFFILRIVSKTWLFFDPNAVLKVVQSYKELCMLCLNEMLVWNCTDSLLWKNQFAISNWMYLMLNLVHPTISRSFPVVKQRGPEN